MCGHKSEAQLGGGWTVRVSCDVPVRRVVGAAILCRLDQGEGLCPRLPHTDGWHVGAGRQPRASLHRAAWVSSQRDSHVPRSPE